ncbi:polymorphic toxin-type HINT domain-containing protein [Amycolatopsis sp. NPDC052450]|uniref:polymorphic toxin-type HINT domain-containing protein n=1 Tax=Amycolatopsis sp. NPDC052450 TaxID=3363937 RepID=UPI0037C62B80
MNNKADPTRAILYSVAGGVLTAVFGVLGATDAHAEPRDTAGQPPAKDPSPKKAEAPAGRLTGPTPERARQQAADVRKAREDRSAKEKEKTTTKEVKAETPQRKTARDAGRSSEQEKKKEEKKDDGRSRLTGPTPERARQQAADVRKAREDRSTKEEKKTKEDKRASNSRDLVDDGGRGAGGGTREIIQDLTSAGSRPEPTERFPMDLSRPADKKKEETLEEKVARTSPSPERARRQSADVRQARKDQSRAQKTKGGAEEKNSSGQARVPDHLREVLTDKPKSDSVDRLPGMLPNTVVTDRGKSAGARGGQRENLDDVLTSGPTRKQADEFPGMAKNTPARAGKVTVKDPDDHLVGNVLDEARETIVEGLESIPPAIKGFVDANQDATTWSEADPNSAEWRAANQRIKERGKAIEGVVRNPGKVVEEVIRPYKEDWNSDKPERVVGRAAVDIGTMFIPGAGISKRVLNATEALSGERGPDLGAVAQARPDSESGKGSTTGTPAPGDHPSRPDGVAGTPNQQNPPDRTDSAPTAGTQGSKAGTTTAPGASRSPKDGDRRGRRVLPNPVTRLPTLPRADSPARRPADTSRRDTDTPSSRTPDSGESRQRPNDRTPEAGPNPSPEGRDPADSANRCRTNSFVPGTLVLMADGSRERIENIKPGELVAARNPETGASGARPVAAVITGSGHKELVEITLDINGMAGDRTGVLVATDEHPFWIESERRWVDAEDLAPGQRVQTPDGRALAITATRLSTAQRTVHNLSVTDINTYYVIAGDAPVLVHNANRPCGVTSMIDQDPLLVKAAESAGKNQRIQKEMDDLVQQFREGNTNPGLGNKALEGTDIQYLRGRNGGRVFFRNTDEGMQIVGKADKANESRVIKRLKELYGG